MRLVIDRTRRSHESPAPHWEIRVKIAERFVVGFRRTRV
jgi:hypothetical protein